MRRTVTLRGRHIVILSLLGVVSWFIHASFTRGGAQVQAQVFALPRVAKHREPPPVNTIENEQPKFLTKVVGAAAQGAVAACVAAWLSAFTEPVVNRLLVERCTLLRALKAVKVKDCLEFFLTTFPTNIFKFPVFEVINMIFSFTSMSGPFRGILNGWLFCTVMLPVTNYRFRKSMKLPIDPSLLYQAYPPTVFRDISYGLARGVVERFMSRRFPSVASANLGRAFLFGITIFISCIVSSPFNELRGYWLQQPARKLPFAQFFSPERYFRSTGIGALIMGISLMIGMLLVPFAEGLFDAMKSHELATFIVIAFAIVIQRLLARKQDGAVYR